jgi:hypothetical protein
MKKVLSVLMVLLTTATLAAATDPRLSLWFRTSRCDPYVLEMWDWWEIPIEFTRTAAFDGGYIWTRSHYEELNYYYKIDLEGNIITSFPEPEPSEIWGGMGVDVDGDYLWVVCNDLVYHITKTGSIVAPAPFDVGWGINDIAWDGEYLWVAYGGAYSIGFYKYDVNTGIIVDSIYIEQAPFAMPEKPGIAVDDDGYIYILYADRKNEFGGGYYYIFEPNGDDIYYYLAEGFLTHGMDVGAWPVTSITPTSLGTIKAIYK